MDETAVLNAHAIDYKVCSTSKHQLSPSKKGMRKIPAKARCNRSANISLRILHSGRHRFNAITMQHLLVRLANELSSIIMPDFFASQILVKLSHI